MRRAAMIFTALAGVLLVLGIIEAVTNYKWRAGDQNPLFGNPHILMNDGTTVLIAGGFLVLVSAVMWILARRKDSGDQRQP